MLFGSKHFSSDMNHIISYDMIIRKKNISFFPSESRELMRKVLAEAWKKVLMLKTSLRPLTHRIESNPPNIYQSQVHWTCIRRHEIYLPTGGVAPAAQRPSAKSFIFFTPRCIWTNSWESLREMKSYLGGQKDIDSKRRKVN